MKVLSSVASMVLMASTCLAQGQLPGAAGSLVYPKMITSGREPRQEVRYAPEVGLVDKVEVVIKQKLAGTATIGGVTRDMNRDEILRFTLRAEVAKQTKDETELTIEVLGVVAASPDEKRADLKVRNEALAKLKGAKGTMVVKRNGIVSSTQISAEAGVAAEATEALADLKKGLQELFPVLPKDAIGPGASWALREVGSDPKAKERANEKDVTYTVQGGSKDRVVIASSAARLMTAKEIGLDTSGLPVTYSRQRMTTTAEYVFMSGRALPFKVTSSDKGVLDFTAKDPSSGKAMRGAADVEQSVSLKQLPSQAAKNSK